VPHNLIPFQGSPVSLLTFQKATCLKLFNVLWIQEKKGTQVYMSECTKASHSQRMWVKVSFSAPHILIRDYWVASLSEVISLKVLLPVRRPVTTLDCVLLKDNTVTIVKQTDVNMYCICLAQDSGLYRDSMDIAVTYNVTHFLHEKRMVLCTFTTRIQSSGNSQSKYGLLIGFSSPVTISRQTTLPT
jgi:hypothetical protein